jgi:hypothetical protein
MMRAVLALSLFALASAFSPVVQQKKSTTQLLAINRRDLITFAGVVLAPQIANALSHGVQNREGSHTHGSTFFFDDQIENVREEAQMPTGGKLDLNGATVVREANAKQSIVRSHTF